MGRRRRRRHGAEFKAAVIQERLKPEASIAAVALAHGLNANIWSLILVPGLLAIFGAWKARRAEAGIKA